MGESSTTTKKYPLSFAVLTAATFLCAVFLIVTSVPTTGLKGSILGVSFFLALMVFAELLYIPLPKGGGVSVSFAVILACLAIYGPGVAALVSGVGLFLALVLPSRSFDLKYLFNFGQIAMAAWLGGKAFLMAGGDLKNGQLVGNIGSLLVASAVYFLANAGLVTAGCAVGYRQSFKSIWYANVKTNIPSFLALVPLGTLVALVYMGYGIPGSLLLLVPLLFARYSFLQTLDARKATVSVTQALAAALEAKDSYTRGHSDRVAAYAVEVARELRLGEDDVETIRCAAEMHDIGKIGTPESLLNKPASLTETELAEVRKHALIGSNMLEGMEQFGRVREIIRYHHEWFDGSGGYPRELVGEQIPIGARILMVCDSFDAMTSDRPYRHRMEASEAMRRLRDGTATQFDPAVVGAFERAFERILRETPC